MSEPTDPTTPLPQQPAPAEPVRPSAPPQPVQPAAPGTPAQPVQPVQPVVPVEPVRPEREGTVEAAGRINFPRYLGGALAAVLVSALVAWVLHFVLTDLAGLGVMSPPDIFGVSDDSDGGQRNAYALDTVLVTLLAAIVLGLLALGAPRPRLFFGWLMVLLVILAVAVPFTRSGDIADAIATAVLHLVVLAAIWSLLAGVAGRAIRAVEP
ncbi:MAG: hypothetical protein GX593_10585 [Actinomycetales bacterium]|nr:hypothetical protein [Actinomycetales bacterium]